MGKCLFCNKEKKLMKSHLIPKFVGRWLKETSVTPFFRYGENPNKRQQDIIKIPLLCEECELLFSGYEKYFSENIFIPFQNGETQFSYNELLKKFIISVNWRIGNYHLNKEMKYKISAKDEALIRKAFTNWKKFIKGNFFAGKEYEHHIFFLDKLDKRENVLLTGLNNINTYYLRTIDSEIVVGRESIYIYSKLPGIYLISIIKTSGEDSASTRICEKGTLKIPQEMSIKNVGYRMFKRIEEFNKLIGNNVDFKDEEKMRKIFEEKLNNDDSCLDIDIRLLDFVNDI